MSIAKFTIFILFVFHLEVILGGRDNAFSGGVPHIVVIMTDDQGASDIGYEDQQFSTPILDELVTNGYKLSRLYTASTCSPSRSSFMTGRYVNNIGVQDGPFVIGESRSLSLEYSLLPSLLKNKNYRTVGLGKWHLGMSRAEELPLSRGFDDYFGTFNGALAYFNYEIGNQCNCRNVDAPDLFPKLWGSYCYSINGFDLNHNGKPMTELRDSSEHYTSILSRRAIERIVTHDSSTPLFMYLAPTAPHSPLEVTGKDAHRCNRVDSYPPNPTINMRSLVCQLMVGVDDMVGSVKAALQANNNMWNNTLLIYLSDNGGIKVFGSTNGGLRGQKGSFYEGGVRVPAFLSGGLVEASPDLRGTAYDGIVQLPDLFATILEIAGVNEDKVASSDGQSLLKMLPDGLHFNSQFQRDIAYLGAAGISLGSAQPGVQRPTSGVVFVYENISWKYTDFPNAFAFYGDYEPQADLGSYLFDLTSDPYETNNLFNSPLSLHIAAAQLGMGYVDAMISDGVESPVDNTIPPRLKLDLSPNKFGCWIPEDSPYSDVDCGLGDRLVPYNSSMGQYLPTMAEMVYGKSCPSILG